MKDAWDPANESWRAYADDLYEKMRMMYEVTLFNVLSPEKLKEVEKEMYVGPLPGDHSRLDCEHPGTIATYYIDGHAAVISQSTVPSHYVAGRQGWEVFPSQEEKTLLSKPHPEGCICPKCPKAPVAVRIGDGERNATLELLRDRTGTGHISMEEFGIRADLVLAAKIQDDLDALVRDLPKPVMKIAATSVDVSGRAALEPPHPGRSFVLTALTVASMTTPVIAGAMLSVDASRTGAFVLLAFMVVCSLLLAVFRRVP